MKQVKARLVRKWHLRPLFQTGLTVFDAKLFARLLKQKWKSQKYKQCVKLCMEQICFFKVAFEIVMTFN